MVNWRAIARGRFPWVHAAVELDGSILRVHTRGTSREFRLDDPDCVWTMHAWGLMRGTAVRVATKTDAMTLACEGELAPGVPPMAPLPRPPDLRLESADLAALLQRLRIAEPRNSLREEFWLWPNAGRPLVSLLRTARWMLVLLIASLGLVLGPEPWGLVAALTVLGVALAVELRSQADVPTRRLVVEGGQVALLHAYADRSFGRAELARLEIRAGRWQYPGIVGGASMAAPCLVIRGLKRRALTVGAACAGGHLQHEETGLPHHLVSPPRWSDLVRALAGATAETGTNDRSFRHSSPSPAHQKA